MTVTTMIKLFKSIGSWQLTFAVIDNVKNFMDKLFCQWIVFKDSDRKLLPAFYQMFLKLPYSGLLKGIIVL